MDSFKNSGLLGDFMLVRAGSIKIQLLIQVDLVNLDLT
jgi:hypothetical protein